MAFVSKTEFAKLKGWDPSNVSAKIRSGVLKDCLTNVPGKLAIQIDTEIAERELAEKSDPQRVMSNQLRDYRKKAQTTSPPSTQEPELEEDWLEAELKGGILADTKPAVIPKPKKEKREIDGKETEVTVVPTSASDSVERYRGAKTNKEEYAARKLELEVGEMEGRLLDTDDVKKRITKNVGDAKTQLANLSAKMAPIAVGITDVVEMETFLAREINQAMQSLYNLAQVRWTDKNDKG